MTLICTQEAEIGVAESNLVYIENSRPTRATKQDPASKIPMTKKKFLLADRTYFCYVFLKYYKTLDHFFSASA